MFGFDLRSLAAFRMGLATIILFDLFQRSRFLEEHYTDYGLSPREAHLRFFSSSDIFSFHLLSGKYSVIALLFVVHTVLALLYLVGWRTRVVSILLWIFQLSLQNRNTLILQGGDVLLRMLLFWAMFLPISARFSADARAGRGQPRFGKTGIHPQHYFSLGTVALTLQILFLYVTAAQHKSSGAWYTDYDAVYLALSADHFSTPIGVWLLQFPKLLEVLSIFTWVCEWSLPFLLISPFFFKQLRIFSVFMLWGLHISFGMCLAVGLFWVIDCVSLSVLLPGLFWDRLYSFPTLKSLANLLSEKAAALLRFGDRAVSMVFSDAGRFCMFIIGNVVTLCSIAYIALWLIPYYEIVDFSLPTETTRIGRFLGFDQRWKMFSPRPFRDDGWFVIEGKLKDGTVVDVYHEKEEPPSFEKPEYNIALSFPSQRWRKYFRVLVRTTNKEIRLYYARSLCGKWNRRVKDDSRKLSTFDIYFMLEMTELDYRESKPQKQQLWKHYCFEVPKEVKKTKEKEAKSLEDSEQNAAINE
jgi:hypothetical protein